MIDLEDKVKQNVHPLNAHFQTETLMLCRKERT